MTLAAIQTRIKELVQAVPSLQQRPVLTEEKGNMVNQLDAALAKMSLAVTVTLASGENKAKAQTRAAWDETFDVVIHRGSLDGEDVPSTVTVLDEIRKALEGIPVDPAARVGHSFRCLRHDLREDGEGGYGRVLQVATTNTMTP